MAPVAIRHDRDKPPRRQIAAADEARQLAEAGTAQGRDARLQEIASEIAEEKGEAEAAFALSAAVALADEQVTDDENEFINQLAAGFGIAPERASQILDQLEEDNEG